MPPTQPTRWLDPNTIQRILSATKRMYHGTPLSGFKSLDPAHSKSGLMGPGIYATDNPEVASGYTSKVSEDILKTLASLRYYGDTPPKPVLDRLSGYGPNVRVLNVTPGSTLNMDAPTHYDQALTKEILTNVIPLVGSQYHLAGGPLAESRRELLRNFLNPQFSTEPGPLTYSNLYKQIGKTILDSEIRAGYYPSSSKGKALDFGSEINDTLRKLGFQSLYYEGGRRVGNAEHNALNILDPGAIEYGFGSLPK